MELRGVKRKARADGGFVFCCCVGPRGRGHCQDDAGDTRHTLPRDCAARVRDEYGRAAGGLYD